VLDVFDNSLSGGLSRVRRADLVRTSAYINGAWRAAADAATRPVVNPSTGQTLAQVAHCGAPETELAIEAAAAAFSRWRRTSVKERAAILRRWNDLILANADDLAALITLEMGKVYREAKGEIAYGASFVEWYAEEAKRAYGEIIPSSLPDRRLLALREPVGVVGAITPWNFPVGMVTRKAAPALAAGCAVVLKPAPETPMCALALAALWEEAGGPAGTLNVVPGDAAAIGGAIMASDVVRMIGFTGSTAVGKLLMRQAADTVKKVALELGGSAAFVVTADADLDAAVEGAIAAKFRGSGQTCTCTNRLFVDASVAEAFEQKLAARVDALTVGDGFAEGVDIGPLVHGRAVARVEAMVAEARGAGAMLLAGGSAAQGNFLPPALLSGTAEAMSAFRAEIFGPVLPVIRYETEEEALRLANDTPFGLAAYVFARDIGRAMRFAEALEAGMVGVNVGLMSAESVPFGGVKQSGLGREGGKWGLEEFMEVKYVCLGGLA
jgi:succinate-semialdehyde dehydrogenase/glutarate-semialdehyde dehydrogenase